MKLVRRLIGLAFMAVAALAGVFLIGMRRNDVRVQGAVKRLNRAFTNPIVLKSAGTPGANASLLRHVGRTSGRTYETPIGPFAAPDGFVIALPYRATTDWARNVLAAGGAELVHEGITYDLSDPQVVRTDSVMEHLPANEQRTLKVFAVDECLRVRATPK